MKTINFDEAIKILDNDGVIIFPTDTVWGLGCRVDRPTAINKFYQLKQREPNKPTAVLVGSIKQALSYGSFNEASMDVIQEHWPGALTVIVQAKNNVPAEIQGPGGTVGIRWPAFELVEKLCQAVGSGIMAGSANFAGDPPPTTIEEVNSQLIKQSDGLLDGVSGGQPPSTVVQMGDYEAKIIRQGAIRI